MQLYTQQDFENTQQTFKKRAMILAAIVVGTIVLDVLFSTLLRNHVMTIATAVIGACAAYMYASVKMMPWFRYWQYLKDMRTGLSRETEGWFVSCSNTTRVSDGVEFHELIMRIGDGEEDERLFFWDDDKQLPEIEAGQKIRIRSFGNYITELHFI